MLDSFDKESKLHERRAARLRQMRLMEEAASGLPIGGLDGNTTEASPQDTRLDIVDHNGVYTIDDADGENAPSTSLTNASNAASHLWTSTNKDLNENEIKFVLGGDESIKYGASSWRENNDRQHDHDESRRLIMVASQRLAERSPRSNSSFSAFEVGNGDLVHDKYESRLRTNCPTQCLLRQRMLCAFCMMITLVIILVATISIEKNASQDEALRPPSTGKEEVGISQNNQEQSQIALDMAKFDRIKDRILEHKISHAYTLEDPNSAQYKALTWIVRDDKRQLDVAPIDDEASGVTGYELDDEEALFQRYALSVLWFQTTDLDIVKESLSSKMPQIVSVEDNANLQLTETSISWKSSTNWLSEKGLCNWHGVTCHPHENLNSEDGGDFYVAILNMTDNNINGVLPIEIYTALVKLTALDLSANELRGNIAREIRMLKNLKDLFLSTNHFTGFIPPEIGDLVNLNILYINDNQIKGSIPSQIGLLTSLREASMFNNKIEGKIPESIGNLKDMMALYLDSNRLTGEIPSTIGQLASMLDLRLNANKLHGTIPTEIGQLQYLEKLYLFTNKELSGRIPTELANLMSATEIHLYQCNLTGPLPSEMGLLNELEYLYLDSNELTGSIPEEWGEMAGLKQLFLSGNNLNGQIPISIRGMESLQYFRANDNNFSGYIPTDMGKLIKLEYLHLDDNDLTSRVPSELGMLTMLKSLHLDGNNFSGEMPSQVCRLKDNFFLIDITAKNNKDNFSCSCCTSR